MYPEHMREKRGVRTAKSWVKTEKGRESAPGEVRCQANMAHMRHSKRDSVLGPRKMRDMPSAVSPSNTALSRTVRESADMTPPMIEASPATNEEMDTPPPTNKEPSTLHPTPRGLLVVTRGGLVTVPYGVVTRPPPAKRSVFARRRANMAHHARRFGGSSNSQFSRFFRKLGHISVKR